MRSSRDFNVILFDLGGVLLRLNNPVELFGLQMGDTEFKDRWLRSPSVRNLERGRLSIEQFARQIVIEAGLPYDWQEFLRRFDAWPGTLFDNTIGLLDAILRCQTELLRSICCAVAAAGGPRGAVCNSSHWCPGWSPPSRAIRRCGTNAISAGCQFARARPTGG